MIITIIIHNKCNDEFHSQQNVMVITIIMSNKLNDNNNCHVC
jgi:hypothetical protein